MPETLSTHPDEQKHFDILTAEVWKIIKSFNEDRSGMTVKHWEQILKKLPQKILKAQNIKTVDDLKKFIEVKKRVSPEELQWLKEKWLKGLLYVFTDNTVYQLSPEDIVEVFLHAAKSDKQDHETGLINTCSRFVDYIKNTSKFTELIHLIIQKNPERIFWFSHELKDMPDKFEILVNAVKKMPKPENALTWDSWDTKLDRLGLSKAQKDIIKTIIESKQARLKLAGDIMGSPNYLNKPEEILSDTALEAFEKVKPEWVLPIIKEYIPTIPANHVSRWVSMVARNLSFQKKEINEENTVQEMNRIIKMRKELAATPLFKGRNILFAAHTEKNDTEGNFFWKKTVISALEKQGGKVDFQRPENIDEETVLKKKTEVLQKLKTTPPPFVFIFDGHGQEKGLHFTGGEAPGVRWEKESEINISTQELVEAYKERLKNFPALQNAPLAQRDYLIFNTCFGHDFLRNFYDELPADVNKPVTIASAEFGQVAYSLENNDYENDFFAKTLDLANPESITTFEDVFQWDYKEEASNPSLYVPDEEGEKPIHLSQNQQKSNIDIA